MDLFTNLRTQVSRRDDDRGAILILTALVMLLLLFIAAFATDLGAWYRQGQAQQQAADVSSLNGVQAYDREVQAYLEGFGPDTTWATLTESQREEGERRAMLAVVNTIIGLLETSGLEFTNPDLTNLVLAIPPNVLGDESMATVEADDGTIVTIVRGVIEVDGHFVSTVSVTISAPGEQFISDVFRDAPQITNASESTVSNCGAECERPITIDPPFAGFNAGGSGDGHAPLLHGDDQVWAVNHHANNKGTVGEIVCVDRNTEAFCDTDNNGTPDGQFSLVEYRTPVFPVELLAEDHGKIYFPATRRSDNRGGLGCFDVVRGQYCTTPFIDFWPGGNNNFGSVAGSVFRHGNNAWVLSHYGQIACVTMSADADGGMASCGVYDTAAFGVHNIQGLTQIGGNRHMWGTVRGDELFAMNRSRSNEAILHCFDFSDQQPCNGWSTATNVGVGDGTGVAFEYHASNGDFLGICSARRSDNDVRCASESNGAEIAAPAGIATTMAGLERHSADSKFIGVAYVWEGKRLFINGGKSDRIVCYDFTTQAPCAETPNGIVDIEDIIPQWVIDQNQTGGDNDPRLVEPYQLAEVTSECLIGLGDESIFFSLSPERLTGCVDTITSRVITPCTCTGTGLSNWVAIQLPQSLLDSVNSIEVTVRNAGNLGDAYTNGSGAIIPGLSGVDASSGVVDLSVIPNTVGQVELILKVDTKIDPGTGLPVFDQPAQFDLSIVSQPTLTN